MSTQPTIDQLLANARIAESAAKASHQAYIANGRDRCIGAINALPLEILAILNPAALSPTIQKEHTEYHAIIETSITADGWNIPVKIRTRWDPKSDRIDGPTISLSGYDLPLGSPPYNAGKIATMIGAVLIDKIAEGAATADRQRKNEIDRIGNYLDKGWVLVDADIAALDTGAYPTLADAYASYNRRRDAQQQEQLAHNARVAEVTALRAAYDADFAAWRADGEIWATTWTEKIFSAPIEPLYNVRYVPTSPAYRCETDDSDYIKTVVTPDHPITLLAVGSSCRAVDIFGDMRPFYIGAFLDATERPLPSPTIKNTIPYYKTYTWDDYFFVNVPQGNSTVPPIPPQFPCWRTYVETHRPDLLDISDADPIPF